MAIEQQADARYEQVWQAALEDLQGQVSRANFETWLRSTSLIDLDRENAVIAAPNTFAVEQLRSKFDRQISEAIATLINRPVDVDYVVRTAVSEPYRKTPKPRPKPVPPAARERKGDPGTTPAPQTQQMELTAPSRHGLNPGYTFESFVVGSANRLAHAAAMAVADAPAGAFNPLFFYGGVGLGKTHLLHAIGHRALGQNESVEVLYVSSERFTNELIKSIMSQRTDEFRSRYRSIDILMIDDIQFIAGKESTQEEFFHTFNELYQSGKQIVISSDRHPKTIQTLDDRLRSRFEGGLIADVSLPDVETRTAIIRRKGEMLGVDVPADVLEYIARRVQSNIRELEGALNKIIAMAQLFNQPIRMDIAAQALADTELEARRAEITPDRIIAEVSSHFDVTLAELRGRGRSKQIVLPRQVAMYLIRDETGSSLVEIGRYLGNRDHSTVMHGISKIEDTLETDTTLRRHVSTLRETLYGE
ncbi:MAG: chromosomal replication initiator protein DnaA [Thermomicrobiales bacterium]